jgi:hypothetical protein
VFALVSVTIQVFTKAGFCGMGLGMCFLSAAGVARSRVFGYLGLPGGLLPAVMTMTSGVWLGPHQLIVIAGCQAGWYLGAAAFLLRERRPDINGA